MYQGPERRKQKRFKLICDAVAFVRASKPDHLTVASIVDISRGGLSMVHFSEQLSPATFLDLDIILPGGEALLPELTARIKWNYLVSGPRVSLYPPRRCGVAFSDLTNVQQSYVKSLISFYTEQEKDENTQERTVSAK